MQPMHNNKTWYRSRGRTNFDFFPRSVIFLLASLMGMFCLFIGSARALEEPPASEMTRSQNRLDEQALRDARTRAEVMLTLGEDPAFRAQSVSADVHRGVVRLEGTVSSEEEKELAARLAQTAHGAVRVSNGIDIARPSRF